MAPSFDLDTPITEPYHSRRTNDCSHRANSLDLIMEGCAAPVALCFMPIFEYECLECEQQFEHLERAGSPQAACPSCGAEQVQRLVSLCAVSSESSRAANLSAAHHRAATRREEKQRSEHAQHHDHFGDTTHR